jgi:hypothetical protein
LETIHHRADSVRFIGLVLELEFHGKTWSAAACCRSPGASLLARGGWGKKWLPFAAILWLFIRCPQQAAGVKAAAGCRSPSPVQVRSKSGPSPVSGPVQVRSQVQSQVSLHPWRRFHRIGSW